MFLLKVKPLNLRMRIMEKQNILEMQGISKKFGGVRALKNVSIDLKKGEVLALIGENGAGKSTLMKILLGIYNPSGGTMLLNNKPFSPKTPNDALKNGISMIHQEISLFPSLNITKNIWIGREEKFTRFGMIDEKAELKATQKLLDKLKISLNPNQMVKALSIANMQLVEIARAVSYDSDIIIMDEPTSALTNVEIDKLFAIVRELIAEGKSIVFISHKLEELFTICDRVTVLKDGAFVATKAMNAISKNQLIAMMVGREFSELFPKVEVAQGETVLEVRNLSRRGYFENVSFSIKAGEILGLCGLMGAGRTEIVQGIFGIDEITSGNIFIKGKEVKISNPTEAINNKLAMVTEDRLHSGAIHMHSVKINISLAYLKAITKFGFVNSKKELEDCQKMIQAMDIKVANENQPIGSLSGGNQQKAIIGRWLLTEPDILILDEPTRGIDVGAKSEIYKLIGNLAQAGKAIIMVSSELPEVMGISDRIIVIKDGKVVGESLRTDFNEESLMNKAFGF